MIEWMAQAALLREARAVKKINEKLLLLSLNKIIHYFKKWTTGSSVLKKIYCFQIDPLKSSCSQKQEYPEGTLRLTVLQKSSPLEKVGIPKVVILS